MTSAQVGSWDGLRVAVITCSTRAAAGHYPDRGGALIVEAIRSWGALANDPVVVPDGPAVGEALAAALAAGVDVVLTTGGTGITSSDRTPEATAPLITAHVPGIAEDLRAAGVSAGVPTAMLSRGLAGLAGQTLIVNLPGSTGGVRDGLGVLREVVPHAVSQLRGGDH